MKKRPGFFWMLFYGRQRRGFPYLLIGVFLAVFVFALLFALPGGDSLSRGLFIGFFVFAVPAAIILAFVFLVRRRR